MAVVDVLNIKGEKVSEKELPDNIFNIPVKSAVLHDVVKMQLTSRRAGSASAKPRSEISGSTRKLFRQKGTGRARRGNIKSPLLRGGGVVFGPAPKSYAYKLPKKVRRLALKMALSSKFQENKLVLMDNFELPEIRTKECLSVIRTLKRENALIIIGEENEKLELSSRNLPRVKVLRTEGLNVYDILKYDNLILVESSVQGIEGRLGNEGA
ncbi:MAG: 50S ribosomal protein L4 [Desulfobacteraceae bacterium IS3]|nr:MAG: 50S ribosomal protein L4 [Desulfobacteraceae bacterium IS3]HAO22052.1 50S ribosomal protein L4 [Desulfobacteraceae bacterium]